MLQVSLPPNTLSDVKALNKVTANTCLCTALLPGDAEILEVGCWLQKSWCCAATESTHQQWTVGVGLCLAKGPIGPVPGSKRHLLLVFGGGCPHKVLRQPTEKPRERGTSFFAELYDKYDQMGFMGHLYSLYPQHDVVEWIILRCQQLQWTLNCWMPSVFPAL